MGDPLRVAWHGTKGQHSQFTLKLLQWWYARAGGANVPAGADADVVACSIVHPRELPTLSQARAQADRLGVPLLVGGPEGYTGAGLLGWGDYVCVGEGYRLLSDLATAGRHSARDLLDVARRVFNNQLIGSQSMLRELRRERSRH